MQPVTVANKANNTIIGAARSIICSLDVDTYTETNVKQIEFEVGP